MRLLTLLKIAEGSVTNRKCHNLVCHRITREYSVDSGHDPGMIFPEGTESN